MNETILKLALENAINKLAVCEQYVNTARNKNSIQYKIYQPKVIAYKNIIASINNQLKVKELQT